MGRRSALVVPWNESSKRLCWTIWITILLHSLTVTSGSKGAGGLKREVFFLNLEDGFFGCQVNESVDVLKVFELSKLCDGSPQCFLGSDELHEDLKCSDDCTEKTGRKCENGACLSSQCHCNDGFGGKGCEMPDENECKFRPCDIFAQCTNTLGGFLCSCYSGYEGDGFRCKDIDECKIPSYRSTCVENAECWNLPGHYACRCLPGFEGDGKVECRDIDECLSSPCGDLATCQQKVGGGYTCLCNPGYSGNPTKPNGCQDVDECSQGESACSNGAECRNIPGAFECVCPRGFVSSTNATDPKAVQCKQVNVDTNCKSNFDCVNNAECMNGVCACRPGFASQGASCSDVDECENDPCGVQAVCGNVPGGFRCECQRKYPVGDPFVQCKASCEDISCGPHAHCSANELHSESSEAYCVCEDGWTYDPKNVSAGCIDINECDLGEFDPCGNHSVCHNTEGSFSCSCQNGFRKEGKGQHGCKDINECEEETHHCGVNALCVNLIGAYDCTCPVDMIGDPRVACTRVTKCQEEKDCPGNGVCDPLKGFCVCPEPNVGDDCRHPCEKISCGPRAECVLVNDQANCVCPTGFHGSPSTSEGCLDIDECLFQPCGEGICRNEPGRYRCECPLGFEPLRVHNSSGYPESCRSVSPRSCRRGTDCPIGEECVDHTANQKVCVCPRGFTRDFALGECRDVNECLELELAPCGVNAICRNVQGSYECTCPHKYPVGNPYQKCEECTATRCPCPSPYRLINTSCLMDYCSPEVPCSNGGECVSVTGGINFCACPKGYSNGPDGSCQDTDECLKVGVCGPGAECINKQGSYKCVCPIGRQGDPYKEGCSNPLLKCQTSNDCAANEKCIEPGVCVCSPPYKKDDSGCHLLCDTTGENPNLLCSSAQKRSCVDGNCGKNAQCIDGACVCKLGFEGDPYSKCEDMNECEEDVCGVHAHCINMPGTYDCRCPLTLPLGNPFVECFSESQNLVDCGRSRCSCGGESGKSCPEGFACKSGVCVDECAGVSCGANSVCSGGKCVCVAGFSGESPQVGCEFRTCENDLACSAHEICYGESTNRICVDGCSRMECGPNSVCFTENHRSSCVCKELFEGNGHECSPVKISERVDECGSTVECFDNFVCSFASNGVRKCVDPCATTTCMGPNQMCARERGRAICKCKPGSTVSQDTGLCELPALSQCSIDDECPTESGCVQDGRGIGHCTSLCAGITCAPNAVCVPDKTKPGAIRRASCHCKPGFTGNPDDRLGCVEVFKNECTEDVDCSENHVCSRTKEGTKCQLVCEEVKCGPNAVCISNNHAAQCQCLPGKFKGDPYDLSKGCSPVPCIYNSDCQPHQTCNRLQSACHDVCTNDSCGINALCIPEKHTYRCACAPGFTGAEPESSCQPIRDCTNQNPCHSSAICIQESNEVKCVCPEGEGDPYVGGCEVKGQGQNDDVANICTADNECPDGFSCREGNCVDLCPGHCVGKHAICSVVDNVATCSCREGFEPMMRHNQTTCIRLTTKCSADNECVDGICVDKQCKVICTTKSDCGSDEVCLFGMCMLPCIAHAQCPTGHACAGGYCVIGCRSNQDCSKEEACLNQQCSNPCNFEGACGQNSLCRPVSHSPQCYCPDGFLLGSSDGCYRNSTSCSTVQDCSSGHVCIDGSCFLSCDNSVRCATGEQCQHNVCVKVCYTDANCHLREICSEGVCTAGCRSNSDCGLSQTCVASKCRCAAGFTSEGTGCRDIDECKANVAVCHASATCVNTPGSFSCLCPQGYFSENPLQFACVPPQQCATDADCSDQLTCHVNATGVRECLDPCRVQKCGLRAGCRSKQHKAECFCPEKTLGDPYSLDKGCESVECLRDLDCPDDKYCDDSSGTCLNPCDVSSCGDHAVCEVEGHQGTCSCVEGFSLTNGSCQDVNECEQKPGPCHVTANCSNTIGEFRCECPQGTVGEPELRSRGCQPTHECAEANDCPASAHCVKGKCQAVCDQNMCGSGTKCEAVEHKAVCSCLPNFVGDPSVRCIEVKCQEESDCGQLETCYKNECLNPCDIPHICGQNSNCSVISHKALCLCLDGYTGDPVLGCIRVLTCDTQTPCPSSSLCLTGFCRQMCQAHRDCASIQSCVHGICQSPCSFDSDCSTSQICENSFCKDFGTCRENSNCPTDKVCKTNLHGVHTCESVCGLETICPRNAHCLAQNHTGICECDEGFKLDSGEHCVNPECQVNSDCPDDKSCVEFQCLVTCKLPGSCPKNSICTAENHEPKCTCGPGFQSASSGLNETEFQCVPLPTDFCADNPCDPDERCESTPNSFKCVCAEGQSSGKCKGQGHKNCSSDSECPDQFTCTSAGLCSSSNGSQSCDNVICGPNSKCVTSEARCECDLGYGYTKVNDPSAGCSLLLADKKTAYCNGTECTGPCHTNSDCSATQTCEFAQCVNPCDAINPCGLNAICTVANHQKSCHCIQDFTGIPEVECVRVASPCHETKDCSPNQTCSSGICFPKCTSDRGCASNERCVEDHCMLTCRLDNDCFLNHVCLSGMCVSGCRSNNDCPSEESCQHQKCIDLCRVDACGPNALCRTVDHQPKCSCPAGMLPKPTALVGCIREPVGCDENRDCADTLLCVAGSCRQSCAATSTCLASEICHAGFCSASCRSDGDCPESDICQNSVCVGGCRKDEDCKGFESCVNQKCLDPCNNQCTSGNCTALQLKSNSPCGTKSLCSVERHHVTCRCESPYVGNPYDACTVPEIKCETEGHCPPDMTCLGDLCRVSCTSNEKCQNDESCVQSVCRPVCSQDSQCPEAEICQGRICVSGCRNDAQCSSNLTCIGHQCVDPCEVASPCGTCAICETVDHRPFCSCPLEWLGNAQGQCRKPHAPCQSGTCPAGQGCLLGSCAQKCQSDKECQCLQSCQRGHCLNICTGDHDCSSGESCEAGHCVPKCRLNSDCAQYEVCVDGECADPCLLKSCSLGPTHCKVSQHNAICVCENGLPEINGQCGEGVCSKDSDCTDENYACADGNCRNPCFQNGVCGQGASCRVIHRKPLCTCPLGWTGSPTTECVQVGKDDCRGKGCGVNSTCSYTEIGFRCACHPTCVPKVPGAPEGGCKCPTENQLSAPNCDLKCGALAFCKIEDNNQKRCICPKEFPEGDPMIGCTAPIVDRIDDCRVRSCGVNALCSKVKGQYICVCPEGVPFGNPEVECLRVPSEVVSCRYSSDCDDNLLCVNDLCVDPCLTENPCSGDETCRVVNQTISCQIPPPQILVSCTTHSQCPSNLQCSPLTNICENPCTTKKCGPTSYCVVENQVAKCYCLEGGLEHEGNCIRRFRTDFPRPEMTVNCLADGIQVDILTGPFGTDFRSNGSEFNGLLYVKGHSKDPQCRKSVQPYLETVDFEVKFGSCGLIHNDGEASFVMVIQKHPRLVTYNAQAYDIKCVYMTGEKTITLGFNVSMLTTSGTIANTGPPPTCSMRIATATGSEITSAEIGESLVLRIDVQPSSIYGGFARRCVAKTMEGDGENEYPVTDEDGCASDPSVFGDWEFEHETQILMAHFNAFKFPSSSSIKFQCNVRVCFGTCPPVDCRGQEAFGRRRRSTDQNLLSQVGYEGQLREEVQIESNPILAIERREDRYQDPTESPQTLKEEVCISTTGFILSLIVTSVLSLVALAVAISCWILAYKRRKRDVGPLPHPPEFPNPLFTSTELITEPLPDYMS